MQSMPAAPTTRRTAGQRVFPVRVVIVYSILSAVIFATARAAEVPDERSLAPEELQSLVAAVLTPLPETAAIEIFSTLTRPAKSLEEIEKDAKDYVARAKARGESHDEEMWDAILKANIDGNVEWFSTPALERERFLFDHGSRRVDFTSSASEPELSPDTPFFETRIQPDGRHGGERGFYQYTHWNRLPRQKAVYGNIGPGSASRWDDRKTDSIRDIREELLGIERLLLEILAVEVCELPKPPLTKAPQARDLPLDRQKIENFLADKGNIRLRVSEFEADGERRLRIRFLSPKGWGIVAPKELTPFAEIVVKADDFRAVYEQRLLDDKGEETVVVTADGFDANGIPREKKRVRRRPDGQHETTTYAILDAKVNIDIPDSEFEFHPPEGYLVTVMGPDGKPIKADAPPAPELEKKPAGKRLFTLNALAVLALAAFTLRKLWLRRRANAAR